MKPIIKSMNSYKLIKYPNGLSLGTLKTEKRCGLTGVSTKIFGKNWFYTPYGKAIFKNYDMKKSGMRVVNELLYDELAHQVGLPVAEYYPAEYKPSQENTPLNVDFAKTSVLKKTHHGLISVDVAKDDEKFFDGGDILGYNDFWGFETLTDYMKAVQYFKDGEKYYVNKREIKLNLYKMMVLDALTFMEDRNMSNVSFIKNDKDCYLISSPIIDNEMCFAGKNLWFNKEGLPDNLYFRKFIELHGSEMTMFVNDDVRTAANKNKYKENVKALVLLAKDNKTFYKFLTKAVTILDLNAAIKNVENMGYEISDEYKEFIKYLLNFSKKLFKRNIKTLLNEDEQFKPNENE